MKSFKRPNQTNSFDQFKNVPDDVSLKKFRYLLAKQIQLEHDLQRLFEEAKEKEKELWEHVSATIPAFCEELGIKEQTLSDGTTFKIKENISVSVPKDQKETVCRILENEGHGSLIKNIISMQFDRSPQDQERFRQVQNVLMEAGLLYDVKKDVNNATLKKHIKEQLENGADIDRKLFGVFEIKESVLNGKKRPKYK